MFLDGGTWTVENNSFLGSTGTSVVYLGAGTAAFRNNLFRDNGGTYDIQNNATITTMGYNWVDGTGRIFNYNPNGTNNQTGIDAQLVQWLDNGDCSDDLVYPQWDSPLIDAGDPAIFDPDGSRSDVGASGGPAAELWLHLDGDGDGTSTVKDCDDGDIDNFPSNDEMCDGADNDCDQLIDDTDADVIGQEWHPDCDGDGWGGDVGIVVACVISVDGCDWLSTGGDCNDVNNLVNPDADEKCTAGDSNCDGDWDLGAVDGQAYYEDRDGDEYGRAGVVLLCEDTEGYASVDGDCNDTYGAGEAIYPGAADPCGDRVDQDCNGADGDAASQLDWYPDLDEDGYGDGASDATSNCEPPGASPFASNGEDCDDGSGEVHPGAAEVCNGWDDDCDGTVDLLPGVDGVWYADEDGDGFGDDEASVSADCVPDDLGWASVGADCDDEDAEVNPSGSESCNGVDDDCDGRVDSADDDLTGGVLGYRDEDGDGYGACADGSGSCAPRRVCEAEGWSAVLGDCDDRDGGVHPGAAEVRGDRVDEDCDGLASGGAGGGCGCESGARTPWGWAFAGALVGLRRRSAWRHVAPRGNTRVRARPT